MRASSLKNCLFLESIELPKCWAEYDCCAHDYLRNAAFRGWSGRVWFCERRGHRHSGYEKESFSFNIVFVPLFFMRLHPLWPTLKDCTWWTVGPAVVLFSSGYRQFHGLWKWIELCLSKGCSFMFKNSEVWEGCLFWALCGGCPAGRQGVGFGISLLSQTVKELKAYYPHKQSKI